MNAQEHDNKDEQRRKLGVRSHTGSCHPHPHRASGLPKICELGYWVLKRGSESTITTTEEKESTKRAPSLVMSLKARYM